MTYIDVFKDIDRDVKVKHPVIAISGLSGSGKSVHAKLLQKRLEEDYGLNLPIYENGQFFRQKAREYGMDIKQFDEYLQRNPEQSEKYDKQADEWMLKKMIKKRGIYVGRLTTMLAGEHGYKIYIFTPVDVLAKRLVKDPNREEYGRPIEKIEKEIKARNEAACERYRKLYGIKYTKDVPAHADIVIVNDKVIDEVFNDYYRSLVSWLKERRFVR